MAGRRGCGRRQPGLAARRPAELAAGRRFPRLVRRRTRRMPKRAQDAGALQTRATQQAFSAAWLATRAIRPATRALQPTVRASPATRQVPMPPSPAGAKRRRKHPANVKVAIATALVLVLAAAAALSYAALHRSGPPAGATASAGKPPRPSPSTSPSPSLGPYGHIASRQTDPAPLTIVDLYPATFTTGGTTIVRTAASRGPNCAANLVGSGIQSAI